MAEVSMTPIDDAFDVVDQLRAQARQAREIEASSMAEMTDREESLADRVFARLGMAGRERFRILVEAEFGQDKSEGEGS